MMKWLFEAIVSIHMKFLTFEGLTYLDNYMNKYDDVNNEIILKCLWNTTV